MKTNSPPQEQGPFVARGRGLILFWLLGYPVALLTLVMVLRFESLL